MGHKIVLRKLFFTQTILHSLKRLAENIGDNKKENIKASSKYYAVAVGRQVGGFSTWEECRSSVDGYSGAIFKGFTNEQEACVWLENQK